LDFRMPGMADHDDLAPALGGPGNFDMHFGDQRTGGVEDAQSSPLRLAPHPLRDTMGAEHYGRSGRHFIELFHEYGALAPQIVDHILVVNDFMAHIDRRPMQRERPLDDFDRTVDARAESSGLRQ